jgi:hypothetical protein
VFKKRKTKAMNFLQNCDKIRRYIQQESENWHERTPKMNKSFSESLTDFGNPAVFCFHLIIP